jgi:hypothetical protein
MNESNTGAHGSARETLRLQADRAMTGKIIDQLIRHLPLGVFRETTGDQLQLFSEEIRNRPDCIPLTLR